MTPETVIVWWVQRAPKQFGLLVLFIAGSGAYLLGQVTPSPPATKQVLVSAATAFTYTAKVTEVYDGDTITADLTTWIDPRTSITFHAQKLRLLGIDTPELEQPTKAKGEAARDYLRRRLAEHQNLCEVETPGGTVRAWDNFGRRLVYVTVREADGPVRLNDELIAKGHAKEFKQ